MERLSQFIKRIDLWLLIPTVYLVGLGFVIQHAILFKTTGSSLDFDLSIHIYAIVLAVITIIVALLFQPMKWPRVGWILYIAIIVMLIILALTNSVEAERWITIAGGRFQPTEVMKLIVVVLLAFIISKNASRGSIATIVVSGLLVALPIGLIILQPDLGSALIFAFIWLGMLLVSAVRATSIAMLFIAGLILLLLSLPLLAPYQQDRISSFINPGADSQGASYNSIQASIAVGSGGLLGRGLDSGSQSQLNFLPAQHTDFVFAVTAEKLGFIGATSIILALTIIMMRMFYLAWISNNHYWRLLLTGLIILYASHTVVNIGMNIGLLPVTGLPLPFMSYGGTFMFASVAGVLMAMIISSHIRQEKIKQIQTLQV